MESKLYILSNINLYFKYEINSSKLVKESFTPRDITKYGNIF